MECLDCWAGQQHRTAVGVCWACGAGVCGPHAFIGAPVSPPAPMMVTSGIWPTAGRMVRCGVCEAAIPGSMVDRALDHLLDGRPSHRWHPRFWRVRRRGLATPERN
jgi:hypothetical protein